MLTSWKSGEIEQTELDLLYTSAELKGQHTVGLSPCVKNAEAFIFSQYHTHRVSFLKLLIQSISNGLLICFKASPDATILNIQE